MSRRLLLGIVLVLVITNILTILFWNKEKSGDEISNGNEFLHKRDSDTPVATIGDEDITYEEWVRALKENNGEKKLKEMVDRSVVTQLAEEEEIEISEKIIERELAQLQTTQGIMSEEELEEKEAKWKEDIRFRYQLEALLTKESTISEDDAKSHYDDYENQYDFQASAQLSHIVVSDEETAKKVKEELDDGAQFSLLAKEHSVDEDTREHGGYMGFLKYTSQYFPDEYVEITENMEEHTYSDPVQTDEGYAVIYLHSKLPEITFTYDEIKPYVQSELILEKENKDLNADELWDRLDIDWIFEEEDDDGSTSE